MTTRTIASWLERHSNAAFGVLGGIAFLSLLWMGRGLTFFLDEWSFLGSRSLADVAGWMRPHNEHWSALPVIAYRLLVETLGIGSYVPYQLTLLGLHVLVAALAFRLIRRRVGSPAALVISIVVLYFGSGYENLYWAFQIGSVGATAAGLAALDVLDFPPTRRRALALALLLVIGLATSGVMLAFVAAVAIELVRSREWRRWFALLAIPLATYGAWYLLFGQTGIQAHRDPFAFESIVSIPWFVITGSADAAGAVTGLGPALGLLPAAAVAAVVAWLVVTKRPVSTRLLSTSAAILIAYALIAVTRADVTLGGVHYGRYVYVTGILLIVALADLAGPWLGAVGNLSPKTAFRLKVAGVLVLELSLIRNGRMLLDGRAAFGEWTAETRALVTYALPQLRPSTADLDHSLDLVPSPREIETIVAAYGSPLADSFWRDEAIRPPAWMLAQARDVVAGKRAYISEDGQ